MRQSAAKDCKDREAEKLNLSEHALLENRRRALFSLFHDNSTGQARKVPHAETYDYNAPRILERMMWRGMLQERKTGKGEGKKDERGVKFPKRKSLGVSLGLHNGLQSSGSERGAKDSPIFLVLCLCV